MAGDLEANKKSASEPKFSDILKGAQRRTVEKKTERTVERTTERKTEKRAPMDNLLPIEETISETKKTGDTPKTRYENHKEPPSNLPTGLPAERKEPSVPPEKSAPVPPEKSAPVPPAPQPKPPTKTPEEILGLPARIPPTAKRAPSTPPAPKQKEIPTAPPPTPPRPPQRPSTPEKRPKKGLPTSKFALIAGGLSIALVSIIGVAYWAFFIDKTPPPVTEQPSEPQAPKIVEQPKPVGLIRYNKEHSIGINELTHTALKLNIDALKDVQYLPGSISHIPIKYTTDSEIRYLGLEEFFTTLEILAPQSITNNENYNLFLYSQKISAQDECVASRIEDAACWGPRLGIIIALSAQDTSSIRGTMSEWEQTIAEDLSPLILVDYKKPEIADFRTGNYQGADIRFLNLPIGKEGLNIPTTSIDWLITNDQKYLIISTSKDATRAAMGGLAD